MVKNRKDDIIVSESGTFSKTILRQLFRDYRMFVLLVIYSFIKTGQEPVVLISAVTGFLGFEVWQLARIKLKEVDKEGGNEGDNLIS